MKIAIIGACGKTGRALVHDALERGYRVAAVCRHGSEERLAPFIDSDGCTVMTAPVVSDQAMLVQALADCDAVVGISISVRRLKATELVRSLFKATAVNEVRRLVFTAGEVTAVREAGESFTVRQKLMKVLGYVISGVTPYSMGDMVTASEMIRRKTDWAWTIVRAPTLRDADPVGYRYCKLSEITSKHTLSRKDYAAALIDSLEKPEHQGRILAVRAAAD